MRRGTLLFVLFLAAVPAAAQQLRALSVPRQIDGAPVDVVLDPDAIPAIDNPFFVSGTAAAEQMAKDEIVLGLSLDGVTRAYPLGYLTAHEIVNDRLRDTPVAVTW